MKRLNNSDEHIKAVLPQIISERLDKKAESITFIGGGSFGRVYKVVLSDGGIIAVKGYLLPEMHREEAYQLELLAKNTSVQMPQVIFTYEDEETGILAMSFVEGRNVLSPAFLLKSKKQKQIFASDVVSGMLEWHSVKNNKFGSLTNPTYDSWYEFYKNEKQIPWLKGLEGLAEKGKFSRKKLRLLQKATEIFDKLPREETEAVLIHADLNIMNIMADPKTLSLIAFIDPYGSIWADREYELFQFRSMWGDAYGLYETYKKNAEPLNLPISESLTTVLCTRRQCG